MKQDSRYQTNAHFMNLALIIFVLPSILCRKQEEAVSLFWDSLDPYLIDCNSNIHRSGKYIYNGKLPELDFTSQPLCRFLIKVPLETKFLVHIDEQMCALHKNSGSDDFISTICEQPHSELSLNAGVYEFFSDPRLPFSFHVKKTMSPIIKECDDIAKNLFQYHGKEIQLTSNGMNERCLLRLPKGVAVQVLEFTTVKRKKCCPDVLLLSTTRDGTPTDVSEQLSACDIGKKSITLLSSCESTFLYLRNSSPGDRLTIRVHGIKNYESFPLCIGKSLNIPAYSCKKRERRKKPSKRLFHVNIEQIRRIS